MYLYKLAYPLNVCGVSTNVFDFMSDQLFVFISSVSKDLRAKEVPLLLLLLMLLLLFLLLLLSFMLLLVLLVLLFYIQLF